MFRSLGQASPCLSSFVGGQAAAFKMFETIDRKSEIDAEDTEGQAPEDIHGNIEFKNVCFSYPARPTEQIFKDFSLVIKSGTSVAIVGESGSGKSTVISLIERFYDPQDGEVLIDNINLKEFQLRCIRRKISLVSQEPVLFTCSIRDNIAYGKEDATIEEIKSAAELANASSFIDKLPQVSFSFLFNELKKGKGKKNLALLSEWTSNVNRELTQWLESMELSYQEDRNKEWLLQEQF